MKEIVLRKNLAFCNADNATPETLEEVVEEYPY